MISQRVTCLLLGFALAMSLTPRIAEAGPVSAPWLYGWLPGDPPADDPLSLPPVWAIPGRSNPAAGLFIAIDPVTRRPTAPTDAQKRAFAAQLERDALQAPLAPMQVEKLPGGGEIIHLNGNFEVYSIARRDANGRIVTDCATDRATARKLLGQPAPPQTPWEEK